MKKRIKMIKFKNKIMKHCKIIKNRIFSNLGKKIYLDWKVVKIQTIVFASIVTLLNTVMGLNKIINKKNAL